MGGTLGPEAAHHLAVDLKRSRYDWIGRATMHWRCRILRIAPKDKKDLLPRTQFSPSVPKSGESIQEIRRNFLSGTGR